MTHVLHLAIEPFNKIKNGQKTIEMRLFDEQKSKIKINDEIIFYYEENNIRCVVTDVKVYKNFDELYSNNDKNLLGYSDDEIADPNDMLTYYPKEKQDKYQVMAIFIKTI